MTSPPDTSTLFGSSVLTTSTNTGITHRLSAVRPHYKPINVSAITAPESLPNGHCQTRTTVLIASIGERRSFAPTTVADVFFTIPPTRYKPPPP